MLNKLERKLGKFAIPHLINYILIAYAIGYVIMLTQQFSGVDLMSYLTLEPYKIIHDLQLWRIVTWIFMPPVSSGGSKLLGIFFMIIMMFFYYQLGNTLEQTWGAFRFNVYMFGGMILTMIGAFLTYFLYTALNSGEPVTGIGYYVSTNYLNLSIFLAFAVCYPTMQVMFWFILPIKMKWMAIIYLVITGYQVIINLIMHNWVSCIMIVASLLNFGIFWLMNKSYKTVSSGGAYAGGSYSGWNSNRNNANRRTRNTTSRARKAGFGPYNSSDANSNASNSGQSNSKRSTGPIGRHKCAICGKTDISNPELTFRFCSKCNGNYEYCENHLYTHVHKN